MASVRRDFEGRQGRESSREKRKTMHRGSARYMLSWRCHSMLRSQNPSALIRARERVRPAAERRGPQRKPAGAQKKEEGSEEQAVSGVVKQRKQTGVEASRAGSCTARRNSCHRPAREIEYCGNGQAKPIPSG